MLRFERCNHITNSDYPHIFRVEYPEDARIYRDKPLYREAVIWCRDQYGRASSERERPRWNHSHGLIRFANETWATAFRIRWC